MNTVTPLMKDAPGLNFGMLLRLWRQRKKLSQLELALQGQLSQRHLSFLELGRSKPSREMVLRLGEALDMPLRERNQMLASAGYTPAYRQSDLETESMAPVKQALELTLKHHHPYPAMVLDRDWNVLMQNEAAYPVFNMLGDLETLWKTVCGDGPHNMLKLTFHPDGIRNFLSNWRDIAPLMLGRIQREALHGGNPSLNELLDEILAYPGISTDLADVDWSRPLTPIIPLEFTVGGQQFGMFSMISTFGTPQDITLDEIRVETFFPSNPLTDQMIRAVVGNAQNPSESSTR